MAISADHEQNAQPRRPVLYDVTHLTTRLHGETTTGIDWVDRAYARHLTKSEHLLCGVHYGLLSPHLISRRRMADLSMHHERKFVPAQAPQSNGVWRRLREWLTGESDFGASSQPARLPNDRWAEAAASLALKTRMRFAHERSLRIPEGAIYLNVAQHGFEYPALFNWLTARPDVAPVFLAHDLLPLDFPEYFREGYRALFRRRFELIERRARGIIATCGCTAERLRKEFHARGRSCPPILVQPLASPLEALADTELHDAALSRRPYFVIVGTIEPRKNHILLLNVWRDLAQRGGETPKLVCVGGRGWQSAQPLDVLERSKILAPHVRNVSGLSSESLRLLLANARALLAPNFAEGYGIPLVEALTLGAPVICSDIPVFREVTQGCATFLSPLDGAGWRSMIRRFADNSTTSIDATRLAQNFRAPNWTAYFAGVEEFLDSL